MTERAPGRELYVSKKPQNEVETLVVGGSPFSEMDCHDFGQRLRRAAVVFRRANFGLELNYWTLKGLQIVQRRTKKSVKIKFQTRKICYEVFTMQTCSAHILKWHVCACKTFLHMKNLFICLVRIFSHRSRNPLKVMIILRFFLTSLPS